VVASQLDLISMPLGRQHPRGRPAHFDHGVVGRRRAVHECLQRGAELVGVDTQPGGELANTRQHAHGLVGRGGGRLVKHHLPIRCDADEVGKRPAHIDTYPVATLRHGDRS
jgi:hypothetical protein